MSLLRGMAAVIPPLLSRASPSSVAKHIAAFLSTLPLRALNPAAMETAAALLSNIFEQQCASRRTPNTSPHPFPRQQSCNGYGASDRSRRAPRSTIALLPPCGCVIPARSGRSPWGPAVANCACVRAHGDISVLLSRAFDLAISAEMAGDSEGGGTLPPKKRPTLAPCLYS